MNSMALNESLLRLFCGVYIPEKASAAVNVELMNKTLSSGFIFDSRVSPSQALQSLAAKIVGLSGSQANSALHKSWSVVKSSSLERLVIQQIVHYITTYGFESLGIYSEDMVYIPNEELDIPEINNPIYIRFVKGMTRDDILESFLSLVSSGIALSKETLEHLMTVVVEMDYDSTIVDEVKSRELKSMLFQYFNIYPKDPTEFFRYLVYLTTGESLVIKNGSLITKIKSADSKRLELDNAIEQAPYDLAKIFFRYKPLFLAMKKISKNKSFFNRLRKDAERLHEPAVSDPLLNMTADIKSGIFSEKKFLKALGNATTFRKIRLLYAIQNLVGNCYGNLSSVYRIRNGKGWVTDSKPVENSDFVISLADRVMGIILESIRDDISDKVSGKTFVIPDYVEYGLPQSEKQFFGNIPLNSYVSVNEDLVVGINWYNIEDNDQWSSRKDLDFSLVGSVKYGWNGYYRNESGGILFSGDATNAPKPNGASEIFYISRDSLVTDNMLLYVNDFTFNRSDPISYRLFVAKEKVRGINHEKKYLVDISNIMVVEENKLTAAQSVVGLLTKVGKELRVYFSPMSYGNASSISSGVGKSSNSLREYYEMSCLNAIPLREIIEMAGGKIVSERSDDDGDAIDLSPSVITKDSIISIFS